MAVALVLAEDAGAGPLTFPGFPGVWTQGAPIEADVFVHAGIFETVDAVLAAAELLPLEQVKVAKGSAPLPERPNHLPNADEAQAEADAQPDDEAAAEPEPDAGGEA